MLPKTCFGTRFALNRLCTAGRQSLCNPAANFVPATRRDNVASRGDKSAASMPHETSQQTLRNTKQPQHGGGPAETRWRRVPWRALSAAFFDDGEGWAAPSEASRRRMAAPRSQHAPWPLWPAPPLLLPTSRAAVCGAPHGHRRRSRQGGNGCGPH